MRLTPGAAAVVVFGAFVVIGVMEVLRPTWLGEAPIRLLVAWVFVSVLMDE